MAVRCCREQGRTVSASFAFVAVVFLAGGVALAEEGRVRPPAVAGAFYPGNAGRLRRQVESFLEKAKPEVPAQYRQKLPAAVIVPHAGLRYSGRTAAHAYKLLQGRKKPDRIVLIGPTHNFAFRATISPTPYGYYETPLGRLPVDTEAAAALSRNKACRSLIAVHGPEHCLEVQLPFLQVLWPEPPKILPIIVGRLEPGECKQAAEALKTVLGENTLLIVSSDFTHYGPRFGYTPFGDLQGETLIKKIRDLDMGAVNFIEGLDPAGFRRYVRETGATICGRVAIRIMLRTFSGGGRYYSVPLHYSTSAEVTGDYGNTVSYFAWALYRKVGAGRDNAFSVAERRTMLELARSALCHRLEKGASYQVELARYPVNLRRRCGLFVTLTKDGRLRGCRGTTRPTAPLAQSIAAMAVESALADRRFKPVTRDELDGLEIEISVLSPPVVVEDVSEIEVGRDGLIISKHFHRGLLLPQVPTQYGWDRKQFLEHLCRKADLPTDAWKDARIYRFTAEVFSESELKKIQH